ncbi:MULTISPECIES: PilW family protein [Alteromonadaceae]|uniref:PilW family protein n=1 Tax=Alteromonadaceae TaxID=72275 RepID=UPI001C0A3CB5|nr:MULTISPECIES: PilW family protein [Aliiglaciecola]MBU2879709.1 PilW family protein [Aliiglaciecola lipolytica]MDO6710012.1 PilW family protein [Aliiglaciecola sp. 2_MG-2023]MDO6751160.1 PilW family protein [Aliiglaciecola sp. 1_MG-2023]
MRAFNRSQGGFSLVEIMITLALGLLITGAIIQVLVSNSLTERLNRSLSSTQESGRFIITRLRNELLMSGLYDILDPALNTDQDIVLESAFVRNHPVILPGDFAAFDDVGSAQGASGASDKVAVAMQGKTDCRGYKLGYADDEEFFVVNEYFVDGKTLKCRGFDGRVLRGQKVAVGHDGHSPVILLDEVESFQVQYGYTNNLLTGDNSARPVSYVTADQLPAILADNGQVVAIRIAVLIKGDAEVFLNSVPSFKLLNETAISPSENRLFKLFETTITLRNAKNLMRSIKV